MNRLYEKFTSRKFIACLLGVIVGVAVTFGIDGDTISDVAGIVMIFGSVSTYQIVEGNVDKESVKNNAIRELLNELLGDTLESDGDSDTESP